MTAPSAGIALKSARGRWIVATTVLGSSLAMLDSTVVNVALPTIGRDLDASVAGLQWTVSAYTLTLAALILLGGSLSDRFGRRRLFVVGTAWFGVASALCALAPTLELLVTGRAVQGIGAALLTPGSLAIISASIAKEDTGAAIGWWSGLGGAAAAIGPLLGGYLVDAVGWRSVFLINVPLAVVVVWVAARHVPETFDPEAPAHTDVSGAVLGAAGLAALTYGSIQGDQVALIGGALAMIAFVVAERRSPHPLVPPALFGSRVFTAITAVTFAVYAAIGGVFFLLVLQLQVSMGYSPIEAGSATLPITGLMLLLSSRSGALASRIGPRLPMTVGPLLAAAGLLAMTRIETGSSYPGTVLPAVVIFGLGLVTLVAPLTAAVFSASPAELAGTSSAVNNAVARTSQLLAVAALPGLVGLSGDDFADPAAFGDGFRASMIVCAVLLGLGSLISLIWVRAPRPAAEPEPHFHCDVTAPPGQGRPLTPERP